MSHREDDGTGRSTREDGLTHLGPDGRPTMVDVTGKPPTNRLAVAEGRIVMAPQTLALLRSGEAPKGDVLRVAELAGIMAGKKTGDLIPLCHQLPGASVEVRLETDTDLPGVRAQAVARFVGTTGVEMEALTAVSVALLTVYDMLKAVDRGMRIEAVRLLRKEGGRSGSWSARVEV